MRCASALSTSADAAASADDLLARISASLNGETADLALIFASAERAESLAVIAERLRTEGIARHVLGTTGESIIGEDREIEEGPAVSVWAIRLPNATLTPMRLREEFDGIDTLAGLVRDRPNENGRALLILAEPFTFPTDQWLKRLNDEAPSLRVLGGMASAGRIPGKNRLVIDGNVVSDGAVAMLIDGPDPIRAVVSQGCRPIGRPMIVTKADSNLIQELGREPALDRLRSTYEALEPGDQELAREGLHVGRVINEYQDAFRRGDFLVRNVLGTDEKGGIAITDLVRVGQTVQFHVRDAQTADEDLRDLLAQDRTGAPIAGALIFSCNGRGTRLFPEANHDVTALRETLGAIPAAGFFAMGEIGPIGGKNFQHGFTASIALFETTPE
jgi:small ligand-binding sensory domain FIST